MFKIRDVEITEHLIRCESIFRSANFVGIDPGQVHCGLTVIAGMFDVNCFCYEIILPKISDVFQRMMTIQYTIFHLLDHSINLDAGNIYAVIEGASYGSRFGQVALAEARIISGMEILYFHESSKVKIVAPSKIRKMVFGYGKMLAEKQYLELPPDAASSYACAVYASLYADFTDLGQTQKCFPPYTASSPQ
jgi:Holliday junction resolvasome RuvABC endonuclease subunit